MTLIGKDRWSGIRAATLAVIVLGIAVYASLVHADKLARINWWLVALLCGVSVVVFVLYRWNAAPARETSYDVADLFMSNGRADLWKHMVLLFATISAWVIVQQALAKTLSTEMLSIVLGIFVGKEAVGQIAVAWATKPTAPPASGDQTVNVLPVAVPAAPATPAAPLKVDVLNLPDPKPERPKGKRRGR